MVRLSLKKTKIRYLLRRIYHVEIDRAGLNSVWRVVAFALSVELSRRPPPPLIIRIRRVFWHC